MIVTQRQLFVLAYNFASSEKRIQAQTEFYCLKFKHAYPYSIGNMLHKTEF